MTRLENVFDSSHIQVITIADFCNPQRQYQYAQRIAEIRSYCPDAETKERNKKIVDRLKTSLPAGIISCVADGLGESNVIARNGVMAIDIDASKNPAIYDWNAVKTELAKSPYIAYCGLSVSGLGVWGMIPISIPEKHLEHFRAISKDFERQFCIWQNGDQEPTILNGIHLDSAPSSIISKRFVSYDPHPYTNVNAKIYERMEELPQPRRTFFNHTSKEFDVEGWLKAHGIAYNARYRHGGIQFIVRCPNAAQHSSKHKAESAVFLYPDGRPGYDCKHDHCSHIHWQEYRKIYEPTYNPDGNYGKVINRLSQDDIQEALKSAGISPRATTSARLASKGEVTDESSVMSEAYIERKFRIIDDPLSPDTTNIWEGMSESEFSSVLSPEAVTQWQATHHAIPF